LGFVINLFWREEDKEKPRRQRASKEREKEIQMDRVRG
jgi:hypothetical protein